MVAPRGMALVVLIALASGDSMAGNGKLTADELQVLLNGNTAVGDWHGTPYKQYFATSGTTTYAAKGDPPSIGRWKIDSETGNYCSWWERSGWSCYAVEREGEGYVWVVPDGDGYRGPFTVVEGNRL